MSCIYSMPVYTLCIMHIHYIYICTYVFKDSGDGENRYWERRVGVDVSEPQDFDITKLRSHPKPKQTKKYKNNQWDSDSQQCPGGNGTSQGLGLPMSECVFWPGEMAQWLSVLAALPEDLNLVPSTTWPQPQSSPISCSLIWNTSSYRHRPCKDHVAPTSKDSSWDFPIVSQGWEATKLFR